MDLMISSERRGHQLAGGEIASILRGDFQVYSDDGRLRVEEPRYRQREVAI
jgi:hypothetical protein